MAHSMDHRIFACYALLLMCYMVNMEKEPCRTSVQCSSDHSRKQIMVQKVVNGRKEVFVIHILIVIEELNFCENYASFGNKSGTCPIAFGIFWPSLGN